MLRWLRALVPCLWLSGSAIAGEVQDVVLGTKVGTVDVQLLIPGDAKVLRGTIMHAAHYKLSATDREGFGVAKVAFYEGDRLLGEAARAPWRLTWKGISQRLHAVWAQWTTPEGKLGASLPALIVVRAGPGK